MTGRLTHWLLAQVFLVTGGNSGIGKATCLQLLKHGGKVYLAARSADKARDAIEELVREAGEAARERLVVHQLDLGDLQAVRRSAEAFLAKEARLDVLFNNAQVGSRSAAVARARCRRGGQELTSLVHVRRSGVMMCPVGDLTADGYDLQFGRWTRRRATSSRDATC